MGIKKFLVIGDSCKDIFVYGKCNRICPEAPVPVFIPNSEITNGGMAQNVQSNVISLTGDCDILTNSNWRDVTKTRYVDSRTNQMLLRKDEKDSLIPHISIINIAYLNTFDCIIVADYDKGFLNQKDIGRICSNHPLVIIDTKKILGGWATNASFIKINQEEYERTKITLNTIKDIDKKLIVTYAEEGCKYMGELIPNENNVEVRDVSGAGDTFLAGFAIKYTETNDVYESISFAQDCAGVVVAKKGVSTVK